MEKKNTNWDLNGISCSFENGERVQNLWRYEALKLFRQISIHREDIAAQAKSPQILRLTRDRLSHMATMLQEHLVLLEDILSSLDWRKVDDYSFAKYLNENLGASTLMNEYPNFFRDWAWGEKENLQSISLIQDVVKHSTELGNTIALGVGGGRLAYDVFQKYQVSNMTLVDVNPMNLLIAKRIIEGEELKLIEFPMIPKDSKSFAVPNTLKAPTKYTEKFDYLLTDARTIDVGDTPYNTVVTPWLIDVIDMEFDQFCKKVNQLLIEGGRWINYGPIGFNHSELAKYYSLEETLYLVEKNGFKIENKRYELLPYMQSPNSNTHRTERVLCFDAIKTHDVTYQPTQELTEENYWDDIKDKPINLPIRNLGLVEMYVFNKDVYELMAQGKTPAQIVDAVSKNLNIPKENLQLMIQDMLKGVESLIRQNPNA